MNVRVTNLIAAARKQPNPSADLLAVLESFNAAFNEPDRDAILNLADAQRGREGDIEFDEDALISAGNDNGVYVQAWVWISFLETLLDKDKIMEERMSSPIPEDEAP